MSHGNFKTKKKKHISSSSMSKYQTNNRPIFLRRHRDILSSIYFFFPGSTLSLIYEIFLFYSVLIARTINSVPGFAALRDSLSLANVFFSSPMLPTGIFSEQSFLRLVGLRMPNVASRKNRDVKTGTKHFWSCRGSSDPSFFFPESIPPKIFSSLRIENKPPRVRRILVFIDYEFVTFEITNNQG